MLRTVKPLRMTPMDCFNPLFARITTLYPKVAKNVVTLDRRTVQISTITPSYFLVRAVAWEYDEGLTARQTNTHTHRQTAVAKIHLRGYMQM